jgi:hypothetical protein
MKQILLILCCYLIFDSNCYAQKLFSDENDSVFYQIVEVASFVLENDSVEIIENRDFRLGRLFIFKGKNLYMVSNDFLKKKYPLFLKIYSSSVEKIEKDVYRASGWGVLKGSKQSYELTLEEKGQKAILKVFYEQSPQEIILDIKGQKRTLEIKRERIGVIYRLNRGRIIYDEERRPLYFVGRGEYN